MSSPTRYDPKRPQESVAAVAHAMLLRYERTHPGLKGDEKTEFYNDSAAAADQMLEYKKNIPIEKAIELTEQHEAFADKYRCGKIEFRSGVFTGELPRCINILSTSYAKKRHDFKPETGLDEEFVEKKYPKHKLPTITSDDPKEIEAVLKRDYPEAYKAYRNASFVTSVPADVFLKIITRVTRELEGIEISEGPIGLLETYNKDPLATLVSEMGMYTRYYSAESFSMVMLASVKVAKKQSDISFYNIKLLVSEGFALGYNAKRSYNNEVMLTSRTDIMKPVCDLYLELAEKGLSPNVIDGDNLGQMYRQIEDNSKRGTDIAKDFALAVAEVREFIFSLEKIQKGLALKGHISVLSVINSAGNCSPERIKRKGDILLGYLQTLKDRGEKDLSKALDQLWWRRTFITEELVERLLLLHEHYAILEFPRLQDKSQSFELIDELIKNADPKYNADKPTAVVVMPRVGHSFLFDSFATGIFYKMLITLSKKYKLMVYSEASEKGPAHAAKKARQMSGKKAGLLIKAGHGSQYTLNLGSDIWDHYLKKELRIEGTGYIEHGNNEEERVLDITDGKEMAALAEDLEDGAPIILYSCATATGREKSVNLANTLAYNLPGHPVYAPDNITTGVKLLTDPEDNITYVKFLPSDDPDNGETRAYAAIRPK